MPGAAVIANQRRVFAGFLQEILPHVRSDRALPQRIERLLKGDRRLGSRDRRLYRELLYTAVRFLPWLERIGREAPPDDRIDAVVWLAADVPATAALRAALDGWPPPAEALSAKEAALAARFGALPSLLPDWALEECPAALVPAEYAALHRRAPLWIRMRSPEDEAPVREEFEARSWPLFQADALSSAWRAQAEADLTRTDSFRAGRFEVQDIGSQLILSSSEIAPGGRWLDACAGAGGKTLQLAGLLGPAGRVDAYDVREAALDELQARAERAGLAGRIRRPVGGPAEAYDGVLVDAPCSGSGTWRRAPHLKYSTDRDGIDAAAELQLSLLAQFAYHVRPGGRLIYSTCSLCPRENERLLERFLGSQPIYTVDSARSILPSIFDGDGFFVASLRRAA